MKKNKMMRIASVLLVAVILTTCAISGTFAKYTTSQTGSDAARVAYWGFNENNALTINLFKSDYTNVDGTGDAKVVAPGTENEVSFNFAYADNNADNVTAPEVAYNFTVNATSSASTTNTQKLDENPNFYWTLKAPGAAAATKYATMNDLLEAIKATSGDASGTKQYAAGKLPTGFDAGNNTYTIGWKWVFEGNDPIDDLNKDNLAVTDPKTQDVYDTAMGNATDLEDVQITITITATQVD